MLAELINELQIPAGLCIEFGAWDGRHLSNTWTLWAQRGWPALLIEADPDRFTLLQHETSGFPVTALCTTVGTDPGSSLDRIVSNAKIHHDIAVLSIDIDGNDYWVWKATRLKPAILVIEYNASFPPEVSYVPAMGTYIGASAAALVELSSQQGYTLIDLTKTNLIFVRDDLSTQLTIDILPLEQLFDRTWVPVVYSDMYGIHHLMRPAQWGFAGLRADIGITRVTGRVRHIIVSPGKWLSHRNVPVVSQRLRALIDRHSRSAFRRRPS